MELSVSTFNLKHDYITWLSTHWSKRSQSVKLFFRKEMPDVVGTQELTRRMISDMEEFLPEYDWFGQGRGGGERGEYCAIFYKKERFRCLDKGTFWLARDEEAQGKRDWMAVFPRICTWGLLEDRSEGIRFFIYNTHLDHLSFLARKRGLRLIAEHIKARPAKEPCILTGDFNAGPGSGAIKALDAFDMQYGLFSGDSYRVFVNAKNQRTYHGFGGKTAGKPVDYIFASKAVEILEARILQEKYGGRYPSDHFPIIMKIKIES